MATKRKKIVLYNTLTRTKEELKPIDKDFIRFYSCGQTVYEDIHVGNAKTYVVWDLLTRVLSHFGYKVKHIQNFTDVGHLTDDADQGEDKIVKKAKTLNQHPMELVDKKIQEYHESMDAINIARPNLAPRATGHITEMIDLVQTLLDKGHAYESNGSIYYDITTFPTYGEMARLDLENLLHGARIEVREGKRNPGDFALWIKAPKDHIMQYTSPWGKGYPGWHLECSVMSMKYLGETLDIHAGGIDHIPVHHTNEIAQSEGATGKKFANVWMHSEFITVNGEKMSKSKGNFYTLHDLIEELGAGSTRFVLTSAHYRTQADFSLEQAKSMQKRYYRLIRSYHFALQQLFKDKFDKKSLKNQINNTEKIFENFENALADDLNVPKALTQLNTISNKMDQYIKNNDLIQLYYSAECFENMMDILGIPYIKLSDDEIENINNMIKLRINLKSSGDFENSDNIRDFLSSLGYVITDISKEESNWYREEILVH